MPKRSRTHERDGFSWLSLGYQPSPRRGNTAGGLNVQNCLGAGFTGWEQLKAQPRSVITPAGGSWGGMSYRDHQSTISFAISALFVLMARPHPLRFLPKRVLKTCISAERFQMINSGSNALTICLRSSPSRSQRRQTHRRSKAAGR